MATLQDVADRAGVSIATVSKVLSNTPYFSENTGKRVLEAAEALGYRPNLAARALSSGKTGIIAVAFPYLYDPIFKDPRILQTLEGLEQILAPSGYHMLLSTPHPSENGMGEEFSTLMTSGYLEGVIAFDNAPAQSVQQAIPETLPAVMLGYHDVPASIRSDDYRGGQLLMQHLIDLGHRNIGIITVAEHQHMAVDARMSGICNIAEAVGLDDSNLIIRYGDFSMESGANATRDFLQHHPALTAIIGINDRIALGAIQTLQSMGKPVPETMNVAGYDNIPMSAMASPALTTMDQQSMEVGRQAATLLLAILKGDTPETWVIPPRLLVRDSTAALTA